MKNSCFDSVFDISKKKKTLLQRSTFILGSKHCEDRCFLKEKLDKYIMVIVSKKEKDKKSRLS